MGHPETYYAHLLIMAPLQIFELSTASVLKVSYSGKEILVSSILPKNKLENVNFCPCLLGQKFIVSLLGELKKLKSSFEINWPLVDRYLAFFALLALESFFMGTQAKALSIKTNNSTVQIEQFWQMPDDYLKVSSRFRLSRPI